MFRIFEHVEFDQQGRAVCPACQLEGKTRKKNLSLIPNTEGAYKCHRGCTPDEIRAALGADRPKQVPQALAKPHAKTTVSPQRIREAHDLLMTHAGDRARKWLNDRGITDEMIQRYQLGLGRSKQGKSMVPAISIPIPADEQGTAYHQKKRIAPWEPAPPDDWQAWSQKGIPPKPWFTWLPAEAESTWVCEGEWDAILLGCEARQAELPIAICTFTCGAGTVPSELELAKLPGPVAIFYDRNDKPTNHGLVPGEAGAAKLAKALGSRGRIAQVPMPAGCTVAGWDVSDSINSGYGIDDFLSAAEQASELAADETKPANPIRGRLVWNDDLIARAPDYTEWLVPDILTANELFLLAAGPRAGKSLLAMTLAKAVAEGSEFLGRPTTQGRVVYVCLEDNDTKLKEREQAQGWGEGLPVAWLQKFKLSELPHLREVIEELDPRLVVIDTLSRVKDSSISESSAEMSQLLEPLQEMARDLECCVLLVHHTGKVNLDNADAIDVFDTIRGSSAIRAVCRGTLILAADDRCYRLCYENGWGKADLKVVLDANTLTWRLIGQWNPIVNGSQKDAVIDYLKQHLSASIDQMHRDLDIPKDSLYKVLSRLATSDITEEKVVKKGQRRCYVYSLELFHSTKALLDTIGQSNTLSNSANPDTTSDRGAIGQNILFLPSANGSIFDQTVTPPDCDSLIDPESNFSKELVQYRGKRGLNPHGVRVSAIGQSADKGKAGQGLNPDSASDSAAIQDSGQLLDNSDPIGQIDQRIDQPLVEGDPVEILIEGKWRRATYLKPLDKHVFSPRTRALEDACAVMLNGNRAERSIDCVRRLVHADEP
jgi:hypothetical protein